MTSRETVKARRIRDWLIHAIDDGTQENVPMQAAVKFRVSRQSIHRHLKVLQDRGLVESQGSTRNKRYKLTTVESVLKDIAVFDGLAEHDVWLHEIKPHIIDSSPNVTDLASYCCTEMINNVVDHSESKNMQISVKSNVVSTEIMIRDHGIGVFNKVRQELGLDDDQHALLELSKGKLTTDPERHSGEGLFFTSRMCSVFTISSGSIVFIRLNGDDWLFEFQEGDTVGTAVNMEFRKDTTITSREVFERYASEHSDFGFTKTHIMVNLARYEGEKLLSRSQAKRLLARSDGFREVYLDFEGVESIGAGVR